MGCIDTEMTVMKETGDVYWSLGQKVWYTIQGHMRKFWVRSGDRGRQNMSKNIYCGFHGREWVRQGRQI